MSSSLRHHFVINIIVNLTTLQNYYGHLIPYVKQMSEESITSNQKKDLISLIYQKVDDRKVRELWLSSLDDMSSQEAEECFELFH